MPLTMLYPVMKRTPQPQMKIYCRAWGTAAAGTRIRSTKRLVHRVTSAVMATARMVKKVNMVPMVADTSSRRLAPQY